MIKTIYILRSAPYDYVIDNKDLYDSFDLVARKIFDPPLIIDRKIEFLQTVSKDILLADLVMCAPEKRSIQTGHIINKNIKISRLLNEVSYEMGDFITKSKFYFKNGKPNVNKARKRFVKAMLEDSLHEKYEDVIKRVENIFSKLSQVKSKHVVLISHGFFIKIIEAYIRDKNIKEKPRRLQKYFSGKSETFKFCEGFILEGRDGEFYFKSYIRRKIEL